METIAALDPTDLAVDPGSQVTTVIRVRNTGSIVERFDIRVVGIADWVRVDPPALSLFPGAEESATITFAPPRASLPRAGTYPFGVHVRPDTNPGQSVVEEGRITVEPFIAVAAEIAPQTSRGSRTAQHQVVVDNRGNAPVGIAVTVVDPDRRLTLGVQPPQSTVGPDERAGFTVRVEVDDPFPFGPARPRPFVTTIETRGQAPIQLGATMSQRAMFPDWLLRAGAGIALAAVVVGGAFAFGLGPFEPAPTETPSIAVVTPAPPSEQPPSEPPPSEPPPSEPPLSEPPPSPTEEPPVALKEIALAVTGDQEGELGASLQLKCPKGQPCRREVKQRIKTMAGEFLNPYTGDGIQSTTSVSSDKSLPVLIVADRPIPWSTADQAQTGETSRVVVDLGPMLGGAQAGVVYAVVDTAEGTTRRFVVDPGAAEGLFNDVYQVVDIAPPVAVTPAPDIGLDQTIVGAWLWDQPYVLQLPDMNP